MKFVIDEDIPKSTANKINQELLRVVSELKEKEICGRLLILEPGRIRLHKAV